MFNLIILLCIVANTFGFISNAGGSVNKIPFAYPSTSDDGYALLSSINGGDDIDISRRTILLGTIALPTCFWASQAQAAKLRPDDAYANLVKAREELKVAGEFIGKKDSDGLRSYITNDATNMNNYELNAQALLESKRLDAESKKDIGTIRRYGVGADVIIMYGGIKNELDEENESPNYSEIAKYLRRTGDALDEVIAICKSNGFP